MFSTESFELFTRFLHGLFKKQCIMRKQHINKKEQNASNINEINRVLIGRKMVLIYYKISSTGRTFPD